MFERKICIGEIVRERERRRKEIFFKTAD